MNNNDIYREEVLEHYRHPKNFGTMKKSTFKAEAINPLCGDRILLQLKVNAKCVVTRVRFSGSGCAISTASSSVFTEWMLGKTMKKLKTVGTGQIQKLMRAQIGPARLPCMLLSHVVLQKILSADASFVSRD